MEITFLLPLVVASLSCLSRQKLTLHISPEGMHKKSLSSDASDKTSDVSGPSEVKRKTTESSEEEAGLSRLD
ncbi:hypothetical protein Ciccas_014071 [Cichlidogyrus casuarinus]|uniref:Uncharacterized protein n=1 Tax=Cichlidogyrus casuarinus TaxID=1844966 RepID=A0ABD2PJK9_9PLAT